MSIALDELEKRYINELADKFPVHRVFIVWLLCLAINISATYSHRISLWGILSDIKLISLFDFNVGAFSGLNVSNFLLALFSLLSIVFLHGFLARKVFTLLCNMLDKKGHFTKQEEVLRQGVSDVFEINRVIYDELASGLDKVRTRLRRLSHLNELLLALIAAMLFNFEFLSLLEWCCVASLVIGCLVCLFFSAKIFVVEYLPNYDYMMLVSGLEVSTAERISSFKN